jgi:hypothetical protein
MADKGIHSVKDVSRIVYQYYSNPDELMSKIEEEVSMIKTETLLPILSTPSASEPQLPAEIQ